MIYCSNEQLSFWGQWHPFEPLYCLSSIVLLSCSWTMYVMYNPLSTQLYSRVPEEDAIVVLRYLFVNYHLIHRRNLRQIAGIREPGFALNTVWSIYRDLRRALQNPLIKTDHCHILMNATTSYHVCLSSHVITKSKFSRFMSYFHCFVDFLNQKVCVWSLSTIVCWKAKIDLSLESWPQGLFLTSWNIFQIICLWCALSCLYFMWTVL